MAIANLSPLLGIRIFAALDLGLNKWEERIGYHRRSLADQSLVYATTPFGKVSWGSQLVIRLLHGEGRTAASPLRGSFHRQFPRFLGRPFSA